jgi:hypothetical protein
MQAIIAAKDIREREQRVVRLKVTLENESAPKVAGENVQRRLVSPVHKLQEEEKAGQKKLFDGSDEDASRSITFFSGPIGQSAKSTGNKKNSSLFLR